MINVPETLVFAGSVWDPNLNPDLAPSVVGNNYEFAANSDMVPTLEVPLVGQVVVKKWVRGTVEVRESYASGSDRHAVFSGHGWYRDTTRRGSIVSKSGLRVLYADGTLKIDDKLYDEFEARLFLERDPRKEKAQTLGICVPRGPIAGTPIIQASERSDGSLGVVCWDTRWQKYPQLYKFPNL
jgi:hypothetical protein